MQAIAEMPQPNKPGLPWPTIQARYAAGESASTLARELGCSRQAIAKRAKREGWWDFDRIASQVPETKSETVTPEPAPTATDPVTPPIVIHNGSRKSSLDRYGNRTPENKAEILRLAAGGATFNTMAARAGMNPSALKAWRDAEPEFEMAIQDAMSRYIEARMGNINAAADRGDARAAQWAVERHHLTRDELGSGSAGNGGPTIIVVNVPRSGEQLAEFEATGRIEHAKVIEAEVTEVS